jgi:general stress protein 26
MLTKKSENERLDFLKRKIQEIQLAKFNAEIDSLLQLPNSIITTLKVDDEGNVWFFASCNGTYAPNMDKYFYASLDYYNKETHCRLHIDGRATVIEDEEDILPFHITKHRSNFTYNVILIKLKILKAEYYEAKQITTSFKETVINIFV